MFLSVPQGRLCLRDFSAEVACIPGCFIRAGASLSPSPGGCFIDSASGKFRIGGSYFASRLLGTERAVVGLDEMFFDLQCCNFQTDLGDFSGGFPHFRCQIALTVSFQILAK